MTRSSARLPISSLLCACVCLVGCDLSPKSSGELEAAGMEGGGASDEDGSDEDDGDEDDSMGALPPGECTDDCAVAADSLWSRVVPTTTPRTWACDVQIDESGRVALAWRTEGTDEFPDGRSGIDLMNADGSLAQSTVVEGQTFTSLAFASDGTLRARGVTVQSGGDTQWVTALDDALAPTWSMTYPEVGGNGQCDWGWTGALVDTTDHVVTYDYSAHGIGSSFVRRHAPDGTLLWEVEADGNPADLRMPIAIGTDQSVLYGEVFIFDTFDETVVHKFSSGGDELWAEVIPGELAGIWGAADGGAYADTGNLSDDGHIHRLGPDGSYLSDFPLLRPYYRVIGVAADDSGFFAFDDGELLRTDSNRNTIWSAPIEHAGSFVFASTVANDEQTFVFASSNTGEDNNYWVSVLAKP